MTTEKPNWTLAYRKPRANKFHRVTNWCGTWHEAYAMADRFRDVVGEDTEIYYVPSKAAEDSGYSYPEDHANILMYNGRRVRMTETGTLPSELLDGYDPVTAHAEAEARFRASARR